MGLLYTDSLFFGVYNEDGVRQFLHILNAAQVLLQLLLLFFQRDYFFLRQNIKGSVFLHFLNLFQSCDSALDGLEVGQHTTQPSLVYIIHAAALRL